MDQTNNVNQALSALEVIDPDECREVMSNYNSFLIKIQNKTYVQYFIDHYRNAEKFYSKGNNAGEKISLIHARSIIESKKIKNEDLRDEKLRDYITGTFLKSEKIAMRLRELGRDES